jgi:hypothetical protein
VHRQGLASLPRIANNGGVTQVEDLLDEIALAEPVQALRQLGQGQQAALVLLPHVLHMAEPIVHQPRPFLREVTA